MDVPARRADRQGESTEAAAAHADSQSRGKLPGKLPCCTGKPPRCRGCGKTSPKCGWTGYTKNGTVMSDIERTLDAVFFRTDAGNEPVREWLQTLSKAERKLIGADILKVQYCRPIDKPLVGSLGHGLWEVRSRLGERIARVIFCLDGRAMVLLHGFIKKTQKTARHDIDLAAKRRDQLN